MKVLSKEDAKTQGFVRYFTGKPCVRGHIGERFVSNRRCVECSYKGRDKWRRDNPGKTAASAERYRKANPEKVEAWKKADQERNADGYAVRARKWYIANKSKANAQHYAWAERNRGTVAAAQNRRRAKKLQRTPVWANHEQINGIYQEARKLTHETDKLHHVDHIVPLQGDTVSGLHWEDNLRIVKAHQNWAKNNRSWPDM